MTKSAGTITERPAPQQTLFELTPEQSAQIRRAAEQITADPITDPDEFGRQSLTASFDLPAELRAWDVGRAVTLSLVLSFIVTIFPARRAARMNPVEALRYE